MNLFVHRLLLLVTLPFQVKVITKNRQPYLYRYYLTPRWLPGVYLHRFVGTDDEGWHNHPWDCSQSIILVWGYEEEVMFGEKYWKNGEQPQVIVNEPGSRISIGYDHYHRITRLLGPCAWTLFFPGQRIQGWQTLDVDRCTVHSHVRPRVRKGKNFKHGWELIRQAWTP